MSIVIHNILHDKKAGIYLYFESSLFGNDIKNKKLGFGGIDLQLTLIPENFYMTKEAYKKGLDKWSTKGRIRFYPTSKPKSKNENQVCDPSCPHLAIKKNDCYVGIPSLFNKAYQVHSQPLKSVLFPTGFYNFRASVWGDVSQLKDKWILGHLKDIIENSKECFLYSVNPPKILEPYFMQSSSLIHETINHLNEGKSVYFGNKDESSQETVKFIAKKNGFKVIHCLSLGDGSPFLPTCTNCKTPCNAKTFKDPFVTLSPNKTKIEKVLNVKKKNLGLV